MRVAKLKERTVADASNLSEADAVVSDNSSSFFFGASD